MLKKLLKFSTITSLCLLTFSPLLFAGSVKLSWDPYTADTATTIKIYAVQGTNTTFSIGNTNATRIFSTSVTNTTLTATNLTAGAWTFTATASNGSLESVNSNTTWTNVPLEGVINLRVSSVSTP